MAGGEGKGDIGKGKKGHLVILGFMDIICGI